MAPDLVTATVALGGEGIMWRGDELEQGFKDLSWSPNVHQFFRFLGSEADLYLIPSHNFIQNAGHTVNLPQIKQ